MNPAILPRSGEMPAFKRLATLAPLNDEDHRSLHRAATSRQRFGAHREIIAEGSATIEPSILLDGWACRVRMFSDGRRQILSFLLPGDLIGMCHHRDPLAATTITAMTAVTLCSAPEAQPNRAGGLAEAYAMSGALEQFYLFRQIARIGRLSAYERLIDWMLEMRERLAMAGLADGTTFPLPMTQEALADALGLTSVHVNRTLQMMRREGVVELRGGIAKLTAPSELAKLVDFRPARVSAARG